LPKIKLINSARPEGTKKDYKISIFIRREDSIAEKIVKAANMLNKPAN
jgi:hypothetical protein